MRLPLAFAVLLLASSQALGEEMGTTDDLSYWSDWSDSEQAKVSPGGVGSQGSVRAALSGGSALSAAAVAPQEELPLPLEHFLQRMARRPRPQQFFGLMGKRDAGYGQISHKSNEKMSTNWPVPWSILFILISQTAVPSLVFESDVNNWSVI
ncbi:tachykinin precursor 1 [Turdus rufiventris]|nr:tachykinin precursor 1 [Turdus rufiventris]